MELPLNLPMKFKTFFLIIAAALWISFITWQQNFFTSLDVVAAFVIVTLATFVIPAVIVSRYNLRQLTGYTLLLVAGDIIVPPLTIGFDGVTKGSDVFLVQASSDVFVAHFWQSFGITGFPVFVLTYIVSFAILVLSARWLLEDKLL